MITSNYCLVLTIAIYSAEVVLMRQALEGGVYNILSRVSEAGSPTKRPGSDKTRGQGSKILKERIAHLIHLIFTKTTDPVQRGLSNTMRTYCHLLRASFTCTLPMFRNVQ